jgi:hypothetical protein
MNDLKSSNDLMLMKHKSKWNEKFKCLVTQSTYYDRNDWSNNQ